jgi:hypothetical protein
MPLELPDCEHVHEAGLAQVGEGAANLTGCVIELRHDLVERERSVLRQQDEDREFHAAVVRTSAVVCG